MLFSYTYESNVFSFFREIGNSYLIVFYILLTSLIIRVVLAGRKQLKHLTRMSLQAFI